MFDGLGGKIGALGVKIAGVFGAFKAGWDIGEVIQSKVITPLFGIKEPLDEIKAKTKELRREHEKTTEKYAAQQAVSDNATTATI